jgi:acyl-CoA reductase-like NAD-dependent aldehyde dehydrogenase
MNAKQAVDWVDPVKWKNTSAEKKLALLKEIRERIKTHLDELVQADCDMKGITRGDKTTAHLEAIAMQTVVVAVASNVAASIGLCESLVKGEMPQPVKIEKVTDDLYDIHVWPRSTMDRMMYADRTAILRVKGEPKQINPLEKEGGIIAVLGAGNYSSAFEMIRALFVDNCVVVHKAHHINEQSDAVWEKVLQPLVDYKALSFCDIKGGRELVRDPRLTKIYFTGGTPTAKAIMASTDTEFISECGGNNPCIIVPGDRPWTQAQIKHHALLLATYGKVNGGAVCGRAQTLVTCKNWPQRREFLDALELALRDATPGFTTFYPGTDKTFAEFREAYPDAKLIQPEGGKIPNSDFLLIEGAAEDSYAATHEAFCQVIGEIPLDTAPEAEAFLKKAVEFCNTKLMGTLGCCILIDEDSLKNHRKAVEQAVTDLEYGGIAVNEMPPTVWNNSYLTWGGNEEGKEFVSGSGNFGNLLSYENVEKSIVWSSFMSAGHLFCTHKQVLLDLSKHAVNLSIEPSWREMGAMMMVMVGSRFRRKDF